MRRVSALLSVAALVLWTVSLSAQAKPNFAGDWVREAPAGGAAPGGGGGGGGRGGGGGGGFCGMECKITQTATELTLDYMGGGQNPAPAKLTYKLDGSESKNTVQGRGGPAEQVSKATWDGAKLVITTTTQAGEQKRVLSLEGGNLVVDATNPDRNGGPPTTTKITFKKKA
jgi:hypothetical protein